MSIKINKITGLPDAGIYRGRATGKTTSLALKYLSQALSNPGTKVFVKDHFPSWRSDKNVLETIALYVEKMELQFIQIRRTDNSIQFDLYTGSDEYVEVNGKLYKEVV